MRISALQAIWGDSMFEYSSLKYPMSNIVWFEYREQLARACEFLQTIRPADHWKISDGQLGELKLAHKAIRRKSSSDEI